MSKDVLATVIILATLGAAIGMIFLFYISAFKKPIYEEIKNDLPRDNREEENRIFPTI